MTKIEHETTGTGESDSVDVEEPKSVRFGSARTARRNFLLAGAFVLIVLLFVAASRYQPLTIQPAWSTSGPLSSTSEVKMGLETDLSNSEIFGVSVLALHPTIYADPPVSIHPLMPCIHVQGRTRECAQDSHGYPVGNAFHSFALAGRSFMPVAWRYSFSCRPMPGGYYRSGPVKVRVTYGFMWFAHTVTLNVIDGVSLGQSPCLTAP